MTLLEDKLHQSRQAAVLYSASVSFEVEAKLKDVAKLATTAGFSTNDNRGASFYALSDKDYPFGLYLTGNLVAASSTAVRFVLDLSRKPKTPPPVGMLEWSRSVGGYEGILANLETWNIFKEPVSAKINGLYGLFKTSRRKLPMKQRRIPKTIKGLSLVEENLKFEVADRTLALKAIEFQFQGEHIFVGGDAEMDLLIRKNVFDALAEVLWTHIDKYLRE